MSAEKRLTRDILDRLLRLLIMAINFTNSVVNKHQSEFINLRWSTSGSPVIFHALQADFSFLLKSSVKKRKVINIKREEINSRKQRRLIS